MKSCGEVIIIMEYLIAGKINLIITARLTEAIIKEAVLHSIQTQKTNKFK